MQPDILFQPEPIEQVVSQLPKLKAALLSLPIATALGTLLAFRPRRPGTPPRSAPVIQTQIVLSIVGALVMLVIGASLARAFGIVGAANLIRYRAKIDDPKDAVVMLSTLSIGLASGVGLYLLAAFGTIFILGVLWLIESFEPEPHKVFDLTVKVKEPMKLQPKLEDLLRRHRLAFELRGAANDALQYEVQLPLRTRTDNISMAIHQLDPDEGTAVEWEEKKGKKN